MRARGVDGRNMRPDTRRNSTAPPGTTFRKSLLCRGRPYTLTVLLLLPKPDLNSVAVWQEAEAALLVRLPVPSLVPSPAVWTLQATQRENADFRLMVRHLVMNTVDGHSKYKIMQGLLGLAATLERIR